MQELELNDKSTGSNKPGKKFLERQFEREATKPQKIFDWIFGVILPVICFAFDPIVFKGGGAAILGTYKPFAYILSFVSVMAMSAWLIWGTKLKWLNAAVSGLFIVGGIISLGIGILLLPFSFLGLIIIVGALGFTPLFAAIVYLRNAFRSFQTAKPFLDKQVLIHTFALSAVFSLVVPAVSNFQIEKMLGEMCREDAQTIRANSQSLKYVAPLVNFDVLEKQYFSEKRSGKDEKAKAIAEAYENLTGENLEIEFRRSMD